MISLNVNILDFLIYIRKVIYFRFDNGNIIVVLIYILVYGSYY